MASHQERTYEQSVKIIYDVGTVRQTWYFLRTQTWINHMSCPWGAHSLREYNRSIMFTIVVCFKRKIIFYYESLALAVKSCLNINPQQNTHHVKDNLGKYFTLEYTSGFWISASPKPSAVDDCGLIHTSKRMQSYTYLTFVTSHCWKNNKQVLGGKKSWLKFCTSFNLVKDEIQINK